MTHEEIFKLAHVDSHPGVTQHSENARIIVAHRFVIAARARPGSRVDIGCACCGHRLVLSAKSVALVESKTKPAVCRECFCFATGQTFLPPGE